MFLLSNHAHLVGTEIELNLFPPLVLLCGVCLNIFIFSIEAKLGRIAQCVVLKIDM